jgi:peptidoglycan glycosyltransferase
VESELRLQRGRILDANDQVLAESVPDGDLFRRVYPYASAAAAIGYYTVRYGAGGVEAGFDKVLRGDLADNWPDAFRRNLVRTRPAGRDVRLTLDGRWQRAADSLFGEAQGALLLMTLPDRAIRAMVSKPGFDPNTLETSYEELAELPDAPLLNRVSQGQYQPGLILAPTLAAWALEQGTLEPAAAAPQAGEVIRLDGRELSCWPGEAVLATWGDAFRARCPAPVAGLADELGPGGLNAAFQAFGLLESPVLPMAAAAAAEPVVQDAMRAALGQDALTVSPLQLALALAALADGGRYAPAQLVSAVQDEDGRWQALLPDDQPRQAVSAQAAADAIALLPRRDSVSEYSALAVSGPEGGTNAWYIGLAPAGAPRYAVVLILEGANDLAAAERIGRSVLGNALNP